MKKAFVIGCMVDLALLLVLVACLLHISSSIAKIGFVVALTGLILDGYALYKNRRYWSRKNGSR